MITRGKLMCQLVLKEQQLTNLMNMDMEPSSKEQELIAKTIHDGENNVASCRRSSTSSSSSSKSSSSSSSSSENSESSSEDCDDIINDKLYNPKNTEERDSKEDNSDDYTDENDENSVPSTSTQDIPILASPVKKRKKDSEKWKRTVLKKLRNSGEAYETHTRNKKIRERREMKAPCGEKCKLQCSSKFSQDERQQLFSAYWSLGHIEKQRQFINCSMTAIVPKYRYIRIGGTRKQRENNNAFYFNKDGQKVRVCKVFFINTLDINDRTVRTVQEKRNKLANVLLEPDQRGKHKKHKTLDPAIREGIRQHINS